MFNQRAMELEYFKNSGNENLSFSQLIEKCENELNGNINLSQQYQSFLSEEFKNKSNKIFLLRKLLIERKTIANNICNGISLSKLNGSKFEFILNDKFVLSHYPQWVNESKEKFIVYANKCIDIINSNDLLSLINEVDYCKSIERKLLIEEKDMINKLFSLEDNLNEFLQRVSSRTKRIFILKWEFVIYYSLLLIFILNHLVAYLSNQMPWIIIHINTGNALTIAITLVGALASFLGFSVIFLSTSFDKIKNKYGDYGSEIFFKISEIKEFFIYAFVAIFLNLVTSLLVSGNFKISFLFFDCSLVSFVFIICLGIFNARRIISNSNSEDEILNIVEGISLNTLQASNFKNDDNDIKSIYKTIEINEIYILKNISLHNVNQYNYRIPNKIVIQLVNKIYEIVNKHFYKNRPTVLDIENLTFSAFEYEKQFIEFYFDFCKRLISIYVKGNGNEFSKLIVDCILQINFLILKHACHSMIIEYALHNLIDIINISLKAKDDELYENTLWAYYHTIETAFEYNCPNESEIYFFTEVPENYSLYDMEMSSKWEKIHSFIFELEGVGEKYIREINNDNRTLAITILSSIAERSLSYNLGDNQRFQIITGSFDSSLKLLQLVIDNLDKTIRSGLLHSFVSTVYTEIYVGKNKSYSSNAIDYYVKCIILLIKNEKLYPYELEEVQALFNIMNYKLKTDINYLVYMKSYINKLLLVFKLVVDNNEYPKREEFISKIQRILEIISSKFQDKNEFTEEMKRISELLEEVKV